MAIYQCKICGGTLDVPEGSNVGVCEYCGTKQTVGDEPAAQPAQPEPQSGPHQSAQPQPPEAAPAPQQVFPAAARTAEPKLRRRKRRKIVLLVILAVLVLGVLSVTVILPHVLYRSAIAQIDAGEYAPAYRTLVLLGKYKDSDSRSQEIRTQAQLQMIAQAKVKDEVTFGRMEQDNKVANGAEDIPWIVLDKGEDKALLVSKYALDFQPYAQSGEITWENSSLRGWLNDSLLKNAFTKDERAAIAKTTVTPDKNPAFGADPGGATRDKLFVLSRSEVRTYFSLAESAYCKATAWASVKDTSDYRLSSKWWTRTPGSAPGRVMAIGALTSIIGEPVEDTGTAVRPAMWVSF